MVMYHLRNRNNFPQKIQHHHAKCVLSSDHHCSSDDTGIISTVPRPESSLTSCCRHSVKLDSALRHSADNPSIILGAMMITTINIEEDEKDDEGKESDAILSPQVDDANSNAKFSFPNTEITALDSYLSCVQIQAEDYGGGIALPHFGYRRPSADYFNSNLMTYNFVIRIFLRRKKMYISMMRGIRGKVQMHCAAFG